MTTLLSSVPLSEEKSSWTPYNPLLAFVRKLLFLLQGWESTLLGWQAALTWKGTAEAGAIFGLILLAVLFVGWAIRQPLYHEQSGYSGRTLVRSQVEIAALIGYRVDENGSWEEYTYELPEYIVADDKSFQTLPEKEVATEETIEPQISYTEYLVRATFVQNKSENEDWLCLDPVKHVRADAYDSRGWSRFEVYDVLDCTSGMLIATFSYGDGNSLVTWHTADIQYSAYVPFGTVISIEGVSVSDLYIDQYGRPHFLNWTGQHYFSMLTLSYSSGDVTSKVVTSTPFDIPWGLYQYDEDGNLWLNRLRMKTATLALPE